MNKPLIPDSHGYLHCPICNTSNGAERKFCHECGQAIYSEEGNVIKFEVING